MYNPVDNLRTSTFGPSISLMQDYFEKIQNEMEAVYSGVAAGNMMHSPAITYRSKVFAFFYANEMAFKLDQKAADYMEKYPGSRFLNPFKNKPPMKGWLILPLEYHKDWTSLAVAAYENMVEKQF